MRIGAHVRATGGIAAALGRGNEVGADVIQVFTQSPRMWKPTQYAPGVLEQVREKLRDDPSVTAIYCHATYLVNLATADPELFERSKACLAANLSSARAMGASGLVLHIGSHRGEGFDRCLHQVAGALVDTLEQSHDPIAGDEGRDGDLRSACPILLENAAGAGGTVGRSFEELASVMGVAGVGDALGVCLDTQHLWASGIGFSSPQEAAAVVAALEGTVGLDALGCLHLNDSKTALGSNRDRHANLGEGLIGEDALGLLIGHPALGGCPAILEVPGDGDGPRAEDVVAARRVLAQGEEVWAREGRPTSGELDLAQSDVEG